MNEWCEIWFRNRMNPTGGEHKKLNSILDRVVEQYRSLGDEDQLLFKSQLASFRNLYLFLSQVIPYQDSELEKLYTFGRYLLARLPRTQDGAAVRIDDEVQIKYYQLEKISEGAIDLKVGEAPGLYGPREVGTGQAADEVQLSTLVEILNERFGTDFVLADQLFFDQVRETAVTNEKLRQAAKANTLDNFRPVFMQQIISLFTERMEDNDEIVTRLMNDQTFLEMAANYLVQAVYQQINREEE